MKKRKGSALAVVVVLLMIFTLLGGAILFASRQSMANSRHAANSEKDYYIAESACQLAVSRLSDKIKDPGTNPKSQTAVQTLLDNFYTIVTDAGASEDPDALMTCGLTLNGDKLTLNTANTVTADSKYEIRDLVVTAKVRGRTVSASVGLGVTYKPNAPPTLPPSPTDPPEDAPQDGGNALIVGPNADIGFTKDQITTAFKTDFGNYAYMKAETNDTNDIFLGYSVDNGFFVKNEGKYALFVKLDSQNQHSKSFSSLVSSDLPNGNALFSPGGTVFLYPMNAFNQVSTKFAITDRVEDIKNALDKLRIQPEINVVIFDGYSPSVRYPAGTLLVLTGGYVLLTGDYTDVNIYMPGTGTIVFDNFTQNNTTGSLLYAYSGGDLVYQNTVKQFDVAVAANGRIDTRYGTTLYMDASRIFAKAAIEFQVTTLKRNATDINNTKLMPQFYSDGTIMFQTYTVADDKNSGLYVANSTITINNFSTNSHDFNGQFVGYGGVNYQSNNQLMLLPWVMPYAALDLINNSLDNVHDGDSGLTEPDDENSDEPVITTYPREVWGG